MSSSKDDDGFLSRWSRRKVQVREGVSQRADPPHAAPAPMSVPAALPATVAAAEPPALTAATPAAPAELPPTLDDVARLTSESDYTRFVARGVDPGVRNAALKKLFTDPHFNVMDGLDIYIDDYGRPDPLPPGMLEQMFQSRALGLFPERDAAERAAAEASTAADAAPTRAPPPEATPPTPETAPDEDTDLRLQPDDADRRRGAAPGAGQDAGRPH